MKKLLFIAVAVFAISKLTKKSTASATTSANTTQDTTPPVWSGKPIAREEFFTPEVIASWSNDFATEDFQEAPQSFTRTVRG
jgi:hypothetical protein